MDTVFIKLISFLSTPCLDHKISLCFSLCRRIEKTFRCRFLSSGSDAGYMSWTSSKISSCYSVTDWMAGFSCSPVSICTVFSVWLKYQCSLSEGHIFNHKFQVVSANRLFQLDSCACGRDWQAWIVSSGFQTAMKVPGKTGRCCPWRKENLGVSTYVYYFKILASGVGFDLVWGLFVWSVIFLELSI